MKAHQYAALFPMMSEAEIKTLALDIRERGQQNPIWIYNGEILDGRNRYEACRINKMTPVMEEFRGDNPLGFVVSSNLHRRHLSESQRAMIAAHIANLPNGRSTPSIGGVSEARAAELMRVGTSSVTRAKRVHKQGVPELVEAVKSGEVSVSAAANVCELTGEEQRSLLAQGTSAVKDKSSEMENEKYPKSRGRTVPAPTQRLPRYIPEDSEEIWMQARITLDRILPEDKHRVRILKEIITYCQQRLAKNK